MSGITLKSVADTTIPTPSTGKNTLFFDVAVGEPSYKDDAGTVTSLVGIPGPGVPTGGTAGQVLKKIDGTDYNTQWGAGGGDVVGPASSTGDRIAVFDGATGKLLKDGGKTIAGTIADARAPKVITTVTSNVITPAADTDLLKATGLSAGLTIANYSAAPADGWPIVVMLKDNGTARSLTWSSKWASMLATLPTTTTIGKWVVVTAIYDSASDTYMCMSVQVQA